MPRLIIADNTGEQIFDMLEEELTVGRTSESGLCLPDPRLSREHCRILRDAGAYYVEDLDSRNGTRLNGEEVDRARLQSGDVIQIGRTSIRIEWLPGEGDAPGAPVPPEEPAAEDEPTTDVSKEPPAEAAEDRGDPEDSAETDTRRRNGDAGPPTKDLRYCVFVMGEDQELNEREFDGGVLTIGRGRDRDIRIRDEAASNQHARLVPVEGGYQVVDEGSRNGTFIGKQRISERPLRSGDIIRIGRTQIRFVDRQAKAARPPAERSASGLSLLDAPEGSAEGVEGEPAAAPDEPLELAPAEESSSPSAREGDEASADSPAGEDDAAARPLDAGDAVETVGDPCRRARRQPAAPHPNDVAPPRGDSPKAAQAAESPPDEEDLDTSEIEASPPEKPRVKESPAPARESPAERPAMGSPRKKAAVPAARPRAQASGPKGDGPSVFGVVVAVSLSLVVLAPAVWFVLPERLRPAILGGKAPSPDAPVEDSEPILEDAGSRPSDPVVRVPASQSERPREPSNLPGLRGPTADLTDLSETHPDTEGPVEKPVEKGPGTPAQSNPRPSPDNRTEKPVEGSTAKPVVSPVTEPPPQRDREPVIKSRPLNATRRAKNYDFLSDLAVEIAKLANEEEEPVSKADLRRLAAIREMIGDFRLGEAAAAIEKLEKPSTDSRFLAHQVRRLEAMVQRIGERLQDGTVVRLRDAAPDAAVDGKVVRVGTDGVVVKTDAGREQSVRWSAIKPAGKVALCRRCLDDKESNDHVDLGILCLQLGLRQDAQAEFDRAEKLGFGNVEPYRRLLQRKPETLQ